MTPVQYWACRACAHINADEDGPVCENCGMDNSREGDGMAGVGRHLREALDVLVEVVERFTTEADYTVSATTEQDLSDAMEDARASLNAR